MKKAIFPGTFDPFTNGHLDIVRRASKLFDEVLILVAENSSKTPWFTPSERADMIREVLEEEGLTNVLCSISGRLVTTDMVEGKYDYLIKGVRDTKDFEYERNMALSNREIWEGAETVILFTKPEYEVVSSTFVRELAKYNAPVRKYVHPLVEKKLKEHIFYVKNNS